MRDMAIHIDLTWGERLLLARRRTGVSQQEAARRISSYVPVTQQQLGRFEKEDGPPIERHSRMLAFMACLVYEAEPEDFGLIDSDLPSALNRNQVARVLRRSASGSRWIVRDPVREPIPA